MPKRFRDPGEFCLGEAKLAGGEFEFAGERASKQSRVVGVQNDGDTRVI